MEILNIKTIKEHSAADFEREIMEFVADQQAAGHRCNIQFAPVMQPGGKPIYMAFVEARE